MNICPSDLIIEQQSIGPFGEKFMLRLTHKPSKVSVEDTYDYVKVSHHDAINELSAKLEKRLSSTKGLLSCRVCSNTNEAEATFCTKCSSNELERL